jgi:hypothetical protein
MGRCANSLKSTSCSCSARSRADSSGRPLSVVARSMIVRAGVVIGTPWCVVASNVRVR